MAVRYMGSKKALAPEIAQIISGNHSTATVFDVFAGMCAVGSEVASRHRLFTNDVHAYAATIATALFTGSSRKTTSLVAKPELLSNFERNKKELSKVVGSRLRDEDKHFSSQDITFWKAGLEFCRREMGRPPARKLPNLNRIADYKSTTVLFPYCLVTSYFAGAYFGLRQAIEIDSLRYAIDQAPIEHQSHYLAALIEVASHCAAAPGHFAQYLVPRNKRSFAYIRRIRRRSVLERFFDALDRAPRVECLNRPQNRVFNSDATELLRKKARYLSKHELVVYADPPYSRAQYSRYYHLLETLVLYDYPACLSKGRYRSGRHQTAFSQKAQVVGAMTEFSAAAANTGAKLYLSYPRNGLLSAAKTDVRDILRLHYKHVRVAAMRPLQHSTMGAAPGAAFQRVWEDIYFASNEAPG